MKTFREKYGDRFATSRVEFLMSNRNEHTLIARRKKREE
jgi:hypothetical protein